MEGRRSKAFRQPEETSMSKQLLAAIGLGLGLALATAGPSLAQDPPAAAAAAVEGQTASINGLDMYYEIHGSGEPLVLIHGAYMSIRSNWAALIPTFAETHQVIAVELQSHGHTTDRDTPITYEAMADDIAALLDHLGIGKAAIFGYSMGGGVAIRVAMQHPDRVSRLIVASASINYDAYPDGFYEMISGITPAFFAGTPLETEFAELNPNKNGFANLVEKLKALDMDRFAWSAEEFARIDVPTFLIFGDADVVRMEHITEMYRLLGGLTNGDMLGLPKVQLLVLPATTHIGVVYNPTNIEILKRAVPEFLAAELPRAPQMPF